MKRLALIAACAWLGFAEEPLRVTVLTRLAQVVPEGEKRFVERWGAQRILLLYGDFEAPPDGWDQADVIFTYLMPREAAARLAPQFRSAIARGARVLAHWPEPALRYFDLGQDEQLLNTAVQYCAYGGAENIARLLAFLYARVGGRAGVAVEPPEPTIAAGIYHPKARQPFLSLDEYLEWHRSQRPVARGAPVVAVLFYHTHYKNRDTTHIDALIAAIERHGMIPLAVFGWPPEVAEPFLTKDGRCVAEGIFALNLGFARQADQEFLARLNVHVMNLMTTRQTVSEWSESPQGLRSDQLAIQVASPERAGASEPVTFAATERTPDGKAQLTVPISERIEAAVRRMARWIALRRKPDAEKRIAILYYNNPPGKGNIGASYLDVPASLTAILERLRQEGFQTGNRLPSQGELLEMLEASGRNVEEWAPGELDRIVNQGQAVLIPLGQYRRWLAATPQRFRQRVVQVWGPPEQSRLMTVRSRDGEPFCVFPGLRFGNVFVGPQPLRSSFEKAAATQHDTTIPPPHCYIAAYLWLREVFKADAIVHLGRHGTLEFLPGKNVGLSGWDAAEVLLGDVPSPYFYIADGGGESSTARRRGHGILISHLTPLIARAGSQDEFRMLRDALAESEKAGEVSPALLAEYEARAREQARQLGLESQLGLDLERAPWPELRQQLQDFLEQVEAAPVPFGLHVLGRLPDEELQTAALAEFLGSGFSAEEIRLLGNELESWARELVAGRQPEVKPGLKAALRDKVESQLAVGAAWLRNLRASAALELGNFVRVLRGEYQASGPSGDPLRAPAVLPTGRNLHDFDPSLIPTPAACELGRKLANQLLEQHRQRTGRYPEKVSLVLWYGETIRHQGAMECQALHLMGVEPRWNSRGVVDDLRLIPESELGRPRVDVVITVAGIYRDGLPDKILLLDRAARMAQAAGDNALSRNSRRIAQELRKHGANPAEAERAATARVFGPAPGDYGAGIANLIKQSRDASDRGLVAEAYLRHNNFVYGEGIWGRSVPQALSSHLKGNEAVVHSRSTNLYGVTDNDDFFDFAGGLSLATRIVNAERAPQLYVANLRTRGRERLQDFQVFLAAEVNSRFWNPEWIRQMQAAGYAGAREIADHLENLYGWQATTPELVGSAYWARTYQVYVEDKHALGLRDFFEKTNPHARQYMLARLLEVDRQGSYKFAPPQKTRLLEEYISSVARFGIGCSPNTCGNRRLLAAVLREASLLNSLARGRVTQFRRRLEASLTGARRNVAAPSNQRRTGWGRPLVTNALSLPVIGMPMPDFGRPAALIPFGVAAFGMFLGASGSLGALQAAWLRRRTKAVETLGL